MGSGRPEVQPKGPPPPMKDPDSLVGVRPRCDHGLGRPLNEGVRGECQTPQE